MSTLSEIIRDIESEIHMGYLPDAIRWCDENCNNAWSNAIDRFDQALSDTKSYTVILTEGDIYRKTILDLLRKFKDAKGVSETESFLASLKKTGQPP